MVTVKATLKPHIVTSLSIHYFNRELKKFLKYGTTGIVKIFKSSKCISGLDCYLQKSFRRN